MNERISAATTVKRVRVLEDRAHVERSARLSLPSGLVRVTLPNVAPVLSDKSLSVAIFGTATASVQDARVRRSLRILRETREPELRALEEKLATANLELHACEAKRAARITELDALLHMTDLALAEMAEDASWGNADAEWLSRLEKLGERARKLRESIIDLDYEIEQSNEHLARLREQRANLASASNEVSASIEAELLVAQAGEYEVTATYIVPGACFRPYHRATLTGAGKTARLHFECDGCVWQNTGEDWIDVELTFSTERPSLGTEPPKLATELIAVQRKAPQLHVEAREERVEEVGLGAGAPGKSVIPGIDDGGEALILKATSKATIRSDGRPYRVKLFEFESSAEVELVCMPELQQAAIIRSVQTNAARYPILAGPTDLVRNGGLSGTSRLLFIAPGEKFELGFGPEGSVRIQRHEEPPKEETSRLTGATTTTRTLKVFASNLGAQELTIRLRERVPVSEIEKVQISVDASATTGAKQPDKHGFIEWELQLAAYGRDHVELRYSTKKHSDVTYAG